MPSTSNSNNTAINMDDLEEGLVPPASAMTAFSPGSGSSLGGNHGQPGAEPEVAASAAAVATAPTAAFSATSNDHAGPELVDDAGDLPIPIGMMEEGFAKGSSASAAKNPKSEKVQRFDNPPFMGRAASNAAAASFGGQAPPSGLEVMDDNHGLPVPIGMHGWGDQGEGKKRAAVELIKDDSGPAPPADTLAASIEELNSKTNKDLKPPTPFNTSSLEHKDAEAKKKASMPSGMDSVAFPPDEDDGQPLTTTSTGDRWGGIGRDRGLPSNDNNSTPEPFSAGQMDTDFHVGEEERYADFDEEEGGHASNSGEAANELAAIRPVLEQEQSAPIIPEAFLVEERSDDGMVVHGHAEPLLPWWKQKRPRLLLGAIFVFVVILTVSLGVPLSLKRTETVPAPVVLRTNSPSQSNAPSVAPSSSPTSVASDKPSDTPSYSPSACVNQISSNAQKIDLQIDNPYEPIVSVDGKDMVVVVQQGGWGGTVFIIFYTLANGEWQRRNTFKEDGLGHFYSVALSGSTTFVGFEYANDYAGAVLVYEKDQFGDWNLVEDPFVHDASATHSHFGQHVDIDGDLACVKDRGGTYLYHQENNKWVQYDKIYRSGCYIAGNTIATRVGYNDQEYLQIYRYNQQLRGVFTIQDRIPTGYISSLGLSNDYLVYWDSDERDAFMYHREETNQTYIFQQRLNISGPEYNDGLALDNDILVVGDNNKTHVFSEQSPGKWEETITLDQSYPWYALSGRSLFAITSWENGEVYYFDIAGCSQAMPTQTPSLSTSPTDSPSSSPSMSFSPSLAPSSSSFPTETCFWIQVAITYDEWPWQTMWELWRTAGDGGDNELVKSHQASDGDTSYVESLCLREGEYVFTIYDNGGWNGICCEYGEGNYNVTSNGMLIAKGGEFGYDETTPFSIPFIPSS